MGRKALVVRIFGVAALALASLVAGSAQQQARPSAPDKTLSGVVKNRAGEPLRGVHVLLQKSGNQLTRSYITDDAGHYRFKHLTSTADYKVWARYKGRNSSKSRISRFDSDPAPTADLAVNNP